MTNTPGQSFSNMQPYLTVTRVMVTQGIYPGSQYLASGDTIGFVYDFAGTFAPGTSYMLQGQLDSISLDPLLYDAIGTLYGGDGSSTFGIPNLTGTVVIGTGAPAGLDSYTIGSSTGTSTVSLTILNIPPNSTPTGGGGQPFSTVQPSLAMNRLICVSGIFPIAGSGSGTATFLGQVASFEGDFIPNGWMQADGSLLSISQNQALFSTIGTTYGGNGTTTFALPDLRDRVSMGASTTTPLGAKFGQNTTTLIAADLPPPTGTDQPFSNDQPSLALNYLICTNGAFPQRDSGAGFDPDAATLGQIVEFAGNFAPSGWALANGQTVSIISNTALFSILGTQYGGDGINTFKLPDLRGRTLVGAGTNFFVGQTGGTDSVTLSVANVPPCFAAGTRIATAAGPVPVEQLHVGASALLADGGTSTIVWIGHRTVALAGHARPWDVLPIRVRAHAFGVGLPHSDLWLSPEHAIYVEGVLIPIRHLVNGTSIAPDASFESVTYFHVELERHNILLAEGLPAESWLDTGNRSMFANAPVTALVFDEQRGAAKAWANAAFAELVEDGPRLDAVRRLVGAGSVFDIRLDRKGVDYFTIPAGTSSIRVISETSFAPGDRRRLGAAVSNIALDGVAIDLEDPRLQNGFHEAEPLWRWTDGAAFLAIEPRPYPVEMMIDVLALRPAAMMAA
jgi:microcystin-dependent protein